MLLRLCYKHMIQPLIEMSTYSLKKDRLEAFGEETPILECTAKDIHIKESA